MILRSTSHGMSIGRMTKIIVIGLLGMFLGLTLFGCATAVSPGRNQPDPEAETQSAGFTLAVASPTSESTPQPTAVWTETPLPPSATATFTVSPTATSTQTSTQTFTPTNTVVPPTPSGDQAIFGYYIAVDTGGPIACGDDLIPVNTGAWRTGDIEVDVAEALRRLFFKQMYVAGLYNPIYLSNLEVVNVDYKAYEKQVSIDLAGTYVRSGDRCDDGRVREQIWTTVRQFPEVSKVYILLNGNLLGDILATRK